jgi:hypothetical protein
VRIFERWKRRKNPADCPAYGQIETKIDSALTSVFTEEGKKAVLFYMTEKYRLTLKQASADPHKLEDALTNLLGEVGWIVVKRKILEQFNDLPVGRTFPEIEGASLSDVFGVIRSFVTQ